MPHRESARRSYMPHLVAVLLLAAIAWGSLPASLAARPLFLPFALRLEGIGPFYGATGGVAQDEGTTVMVGVSGGALEGGGGALLTPRWGAMRLAVLGARVSRLTLETSYTRGLADDAPVTQVLSGNGTALLVQGAWRAERITAYAGVAQSTVAPGDYRDGQGELIPLPGANLHDIESTHLLLGTGYDGTGGAPLPVQGLRMNLSGVTFQGRTGQSDSAVLTLSGSGYVPLGGSLILAAHLRRSAATVLAHQTAYDTPTEVRAALDADCDAVADADRRDRCRALETELVNYITANNRHGTARPLGGSGGLRAYRELRFRAAHTALAALALRWSLRPANGAFPLQLSAFWETGYAADDAAHLTEASRRSIGVGLRTAAAGMPVRLEAARDGAVTAWFLTVGAPF